MSTGERSASARERERILKEYRRRESELTPERYAPWDPFEQHLVHGRKRLAARLLRQAGKFPDEHSRCLEIGHGRCGWLADLIGWGASETHLHGVEIDLGRAARARRRLPAARLVIADGARLPWPDRSFHLAVLSTVLSSILDPDVRRRIAAETERVLLPGGVLVWYDFAFDNPHNPAVSGIGRGQVRELFCGLRGEIRRVTLAPPIARRVAPRSWWLAELLESLPFLRAHLLGVLVKPEPAAG